jgi:methionyl-tRNA formyltransferase
LIVWKAAVDDRDEIAAASGEVLAAHGDDLIVSCGERTTLRLLELQLQGKRRLLARDFLNGTHLKIGDRFGQD